MTELNDASYELQARVISVLRADPDLNIMLFAELGQQSAFDTRVYAADEEVAVEPVNLRNILPRVIVDAREDVFPTEQDYSATPMARVSIFISVLVEANQRDQGERINGMIRRIVGSTQWSDSHIMAAGLVPGARPAPVRETEFRNAWRITREYRSGLVGVVANA